MKKYLAVVLGAAIVAAPAFASKARLQALGEDVTIIVIFFEMLL